MPALSCSLPSLIGWVVAATATGLAVMELRHRLRPRSPLLLEPGPWQVEGWADRILLSGRPTIRNPHNRMEVFVPAFQAHPSLLSMESVGGITLRVLVDPDHPDAQARSDGYWFSYIVKAGRQTAARITIEISGPHLDALQAAWVEMRWTAYGPFGRQCQRHGVVIPLNRGAVPRPQAWRACDGCHLLPVPTHLLGWLDDPMAVLRDYALPHLRSGDIITIGETPLAVMQGRYRHPAMVRPGALARLLCRVFHPTSSLATACGLQSLIDLVGPTRVSFAWIGGILLRLVGQRGGFYRLAGEQARLIDDLTGTLPPYDQTIVLGPADPQAQVDNLAACLGHPVAVVDVNDLGRVKLLASSRGCDDALLRRALATNPAGNADEGTPIVIVRPTPAGGG